MTSILGYLELVISEQAGPLTEEQRRFLEAVERNARRLVRTSEEILFLGTEEGDDSAEDLGLRHDERPARD